MIGCDRPEESTKPAALSGSVGTNAIATNTIENLEPIPVPTNQVETAKEPSDGADAVVAKDNSGSDKSSTGETPAGQESNKEKKEEVSDDSVELSFKGANVDAVIEWLSRTTGKSIIKHPKVQCRLTIVSVGKLPKQEALDLIYHALSLEGFTASESEKSIVILPDSEESNVAPKLLSNSDDESVSAEAESGSSWQKVMKVFELQLPMRMN
ncbi:MAG: hypothetical protein LR011_02615 [Verrucomicrobia bacterium]|nr:hypothetical protein [Verrucomicrobiota bacterium]